MLILMYAKSACAVLSGTLWPKQDKSHGVAASPTTTNNQKKYLCEQIQVTYFNIEHTWVLACPN